MARRRGSDEQQGKIRVWRERFMAKRDKAKALYDERFCRMWAAYLAMSKGAFLWEDAINFQIQITRRNDTLPITRGYMFERERHLKMREGEILTKRTRVR